MTATERKLASCEGKARLARQQAKVTARRMRKKGQKVGEYKCRHCGTWHVGSTIDGAGYEETWTPSRERDRPTPERKARGEWRVSETRAFVMDLAAHPIDRLEYAGTISRAQAEAGRDFEALYRRAVQVPQARDSIMTWMPRGFESDDGNVAAVTRYRELSRFVGMIRDRQLIRVCVEQVAPRDAEIGALREALNEAERFFGRTRR